LNPFLGDGRAKFSKDSKIVLFIIYFILGLFLLDL